MIATHASTRDEHDEIRGRDVLPLGREAASREQLPQLAQVRVQRACRRARPVERREERSIAANETQNVKNCEPAICGPCELKTTGWMNCFDSRIARNETGISTTPKSA